MSTILAELEKKATDLSLEDRSRFALFLIHSLEEAEEGDVEKACGMEAERRLSEIERGDVRFVPGDEVFAKIRRRLG
jgi:putative addiction module component (TIGR02574 family)